MMSPTASETSVPSKNPQPERTTATLLVGAGLVACGVVVVGCSTFGDCSC